LALTYSYYPEYASKDDITDRAVITSKPLQPLYVISTLCHACPQFKKIATSMYLSIGVSKMVMSPQVIPMGKVHIYFCMKKNPLITQDVLNEDEYEVWEGWHGKELTSVSRTTEKKDKVLLRLTNLIN